MHAFLIFNTQVFPLPETPTIVGRSLNCNLVISVSTISRKHIQIQREGEHFVIIDLDSTGGTYLNGEKISKAILNSGDSILLADTPIVFVENAPHLADKALAATGSMKKRKTTTKPTLVESQRNWRKQE
jgi:pSer/pThr/pTyr-binding forkhead associated (FHA) protein